jgi:hypothetical protein
MVARLSDDPETFFLSPQGHQSWRGGQPYDNFPFRKVISLETSVIYGDENGGLKTEPGE